MTISAMSCAQAEVIAGAIALNEARDDERHAYRSHLSTCRRCLQTLGGEREIERTMNLVAEAREAECWQPQMRRNLFARRQTRGYLWRWSAALSVAVVAAGVFAAAHRRPIVPSAALPAPSVIAALGTQTAPKRVERAESLEFTGSGANATVVLRVQLDAHGRPVHCAVVGQAAGVPAHRALCTTILRTR